MKIKATPTNNLKGSRHGGSNGSPSKNSFANVLANKTQPQSEQVAAAEAEAKAAFELQLAKSVQGVSQPKQLEKDQLELEGKGEGW